MSVIVDANDDEVLLVRFTGLRCSRLQLPFERQDSKNFNSRVVSSRVRVPRRLCIQAVQVWGVEGVGLSVQLL